MSEIAEPDVADRLGHPLAGTHVDVCALSVQAGGQALLEQTSARFEAGKTTLIVGRSGTGKSTLLRVIAGLVDDHEDVRFEGNVQLSASVAGKARRRRAIGVVFQDFALFDELTPLQNVRLASAHRSRSHQHDDETLDARGLLNELGVPSGVRTAALSGGQRQRLAIARALAYDPDVMLYDEPTSGLDAATAAEVATLISATHRQHPRTSIIVTHNYDALLPIADAVYLLDGDSKTLREVDRSDWPRIDELLETSLHAGSDRPSAAATGESVLRRVTKAAGQGVERFLTGTTATLEACLTAPVRLIPAWKSPLWGLRFCAHYMRTVAGPSAWLYIAIAGGIIGFVSTYFTFRFLPYASYTEPLLIENLLGSMGFALYRILVPILATILIAARCGAAVASDVGGKSYGRQMDALRTLGAEPKRYLLTGILYAFLIGTPVLVAIGYAFAAVASLIVFAATHPGQGPWFWQLHFHRELLVPGQTLFAGTEWLLAKTLLCAAGIGLVAYYRGARRKYSSQAVSQGVTSTILWSTLFVLAVHFAFAFFEFD